MKEWHTHTHAHHFPRSLEANSGSVHLSSLITLQLSSNINLSTKLSKHPWLLSSPAVHVPDLHPCSCLHRHLWLHIDTSFPLLQHVDHLCCHEIPWCQHHLSWLHLCGRQAVRLVISAHCNNDVLLTRKHFILLLLIKFFQISCQITHLCTTPG